MNGRQFIYHMQGLTKTYPGNRKVLENIHLSFYPDAKIGVLGPNGSGKSTLLRAMLGRAALAAGTASLGPGVVVRLDPRPEPRESLLPRPDAHRELPDERRVSARTRASSSGSSKGLAM